MTKKVLAYFSGVFATVLVLTMVTTALAASGKATFNFVNVSLRGEQKIAAGADITVANGQKVPSSILYTDEKGGKTNYLPIRAISELLGVEIKYDSATKTVQLEKQPTAVDAGALGQWSRSFEANNEGSGDSETEQQQPQDDDVQSEDSTDTPGKIVLDGTPVRWDEFPMPTAETFGLTGEDAIIYNAIAQVYNPKVYADTFSQSPEDVTDLSLPAFEIYEKSKSENGNTIYYGVFYECDYYNLGSDLADLNNPVYSLVKGKSPANLTIDAQGNFVDFEQTPESSNDPYGDIRRVCGPMTELADFLCGETETYSKEPLKVPDLNAEANMKFGVDTEDAEVESVDIQGEEGIMASKNGIIQIAWANQELHSYFNVNGPESMREDLIKVAQGVKIFT